MVAHEWHNDSLAVSGLVSMKLNRPWRCGISTVGRKDPMHLYWTSAWTGFDGSRSV